MDSPHQDGGRKENESNTGVSLTSSKRRKGKRRSHLYPRPPSEEEAARRLLLKKMLHDARNPTLWRTPMGEFIPVAGGGPLTSLAFPLPAGLNYKPKVNSSKPAPPGFILTARAKQTDRTVGPGPAAYDTIQWKKEIKKPPLAFAMSLSRLPVHIDKDIPGPGKYNLQDYRNVGKDAPKYTMGLKAKTAGGCPSMLVKPVDSVGFRSPDTLPYSQKEMWKRTGLSYSIRSKHKPIVFTTPAPNRYYVNKETKRPPKYTMSIKAMKSCLDPPFDQKVFPAPNAYNVPTTLRGKPGKSIYSRRFPRKLGKQPDFFTYKIDRSMQKGGFSMTFKPFELTPQPLPPPNQYFQVPILPRGTHKPGVSIQSRHPPAESNNISNPPPNIYRIPPTLGKQGGYIGKPIEIQTAPIPGPNAYKTGNYIKINKKRNPAYSIGSAIATKYITYGPGPAAYDTISQPGADVPAFTMRPKLLREKKDLGKDEQPSPAVYALDPKCLRSGLNKPDGATLKSRATPFIYSGLISKVYEEEKPE